MLEVDNIDATFTNNGVGKYSIKPAVTATTDKETFVQLIQVNKGIIYNIG